MNIELSKNNHFIWGYNNVPWTKRSSLYDKFYIRYGKIKFQPSSFRDACIISAKEISSKAKLLGKKPLIYYSGGRDSESIIAAFLASGEDFSIAHIKYVPNYNSHEYYFVKKFIDRYSLDLIEFNVDPIEFIRSPKCFLLATRDNARLIETHLLASITDTIKDRYYPVLDHPGTMLFRKTKNLSQPGNWYWKDFEHLMFYYNHCINENMDACPSFYHWSPEIILAFLLDPVIVNLVNDITYGKITNRTSTLNLYNSAFPEFNFEARSKYTGFEFLPKTLVNNLNIQVNRKTFFDRHCGQEYSYHDLLKILGYYD